MAILFVAVAFVKAPIAIPLSPVEFARLPIAVLFVAVAFVKAPIAIASSAFTVALTPIPIPS